MEHIGVLNIHTVEVSSDIIESRYVLNENIGFQATVWKPVINIEYLAIIGLGKLNLFCGILQETHQLLFFEGCKIRYLGFNYELDYSNR